MSSQAAPPPCANASQASTLSSTSSHDEPLPIRRYGALAALWACLVVVFGFVMEYNHDAPIGDYSMFQDVHVMIFIGFGFLMSFLLRNSFTAIGHSLTVAVVAALWFMPNQWFWHAVIGGEARESHAWQRLGVGIDTLVNADFCAGAVLISFGAVIGRVSMPQLLVMAGFEVVFYSINEALAVARYAVADIGGSMVIHTFGAYFGLTVALLLDRSEERQKKRERKWASNHNSDTMAMVGTLFLWCFWPSFNAYLGGQANGGGTAVRAVTNTYLSLCASVVVTYLASGFLGRNKLSIVDFQNATLAGGVAVGATANMLLRPYGALLIGTAAGALSTFGYHWVQPKLEAAIGLMDTCGVHNLHGMPGLVGSLASVLVTAAASREEYAVVGGLAWTDVWVNVDVKGHSVQQLAGLQLATLGTTLGLAIGGGVVTASVLRALSFLSADFAAAAELERFYTDSVEWECEPEHPHVQDHHDVAAQPCGTQAPQKAIIRAPTDGNRFPIDGEAEVSFEHGCTDDTGVSQRNRNGSSCEMQGAS